MSMKIRARNQMKFVKNVRPSVLPDPRLIRPTSGALLTEWLLLHSHTLIYAGMHSRTTSWYQLVTTHCAQASDITWFNKLVSIQFSALNCLWSECGTLLSCILSHSEYATKSKLIYHFRIYSSCSPRWTQKLTLLKTVAPSLNQSNNSRTRQLTNDCKSRETKTSFFIDICALAFIYLPQLFWISSCFVVPYTHCLSIP